MRDKRLLRAVSAAALWTVLAIAAPASGQEPGATPLGFDFSKGAIEVKADSLVVLHKENQAVFKGNVSAVQKDTRLSARELAIWYDPKAGEKGGEDAGDSVKRMEARGDVRIVNPAAESEAELAVYDAGEKTLVLTGKEAVLKRGESSVRGNRIVLYIKDGRLQVEGGGGGQVEAVFFPEEAREAGGSKGGE
jgi:lipopolysaccharide export system protein LptA